MVLYHTNYFHDNTYSGNCSSYKSDTEWNSKKFVVFFKLHKFQLLYKPSEVHSINDNRIKLQLILVQLFYHHNFVDHANISKDTNELFLIKGQDLKIDGLNFLV